MIQSFADWLVYGIFGLDSATKIGQAVNFFFYDSLKILILLFLISAVMGVINAYFPIDRLRNFLQSHKLYGLDYLLASLFGAITPFCSCSSIPLFIGFVPEGFFSGALGSGKWWNVPLAVVLAVPMYSNAAGIIPLVKAVR